MYKQKDENDRIDSHSAVYKELVSKITRSDRQIRELAANYKPVLKDERYYTGSEIMSILHISRRTLQEYRNK